MSQMKWRLEREENEEVGSRYSRYGLRRFTKNGGKEWKGKKQGSRTRGRGSWVNSADDVWYQLDVWSIEHYARRDMMNCVHVCLSLSLYLSVCVSVCVFVCSLTCSIFLQEAALHGLHEKEKLGIGLTRTGRSPPCTQHWWVDEGKRDRCNTKMVRWLWWQKWPSWSDVYASVRYATE